MFAQKEEDRRAALQRSLAAQCQRVEAIQAEQAVGEARAVEVRQQLEARMQARAVQAAKAEAYRCYCTLAMYTIITIVVVITVIFIILRIAKAATGGVVRQVEHSRSLCHVLNQVQTRNKLLVRQHNGFRRRVIA